MLLIPAAQATMSDFAVARLAGARHYAAAACSCTARLRLHFWLAARTTLLRSTNPELPSATVTLPGDSRRDRET